MISLITPTSDRPEAFRICEYLMSRQSEPYEWIVADDGKEAVTCTQEQIHIHQSPEEDPISSFLGNLLTGLREASGDYIFFIEDDDWYSPEYIHQYMMELRESQVDIFGDGFARYYHLPTQTFKQISNTTHASLCQTVITRKVVPWLIDFLESCGQTKFVDLHLWRRAPFSKKVFRPHYPRSVGIKGLTGKAGLGMGHKTQSRQDKNFEQLRQWIGDDVELYSHLHK